jgi:hypothetical protein
MALPNEYAVRQFLARKEVLEPYILEYQNLTKFSRFMAPDNNAIIRVKVVKEGNSVLIPVNQIFYDMNIKYGSYDVLAGAEQELTYDYMQMNVNRQRWAMKITDEQYQRLVYGRDFPADMKKNLLEQVEFNLNRRMVQSFATGLTFQSTNTTNLGNMNYVNYVWDYPALVTRMLGCGIDGNGALNGDNISSARLMLGNDYNNPNGVGVAAGNGYAAGGAISAMLQTANFGTTLANFANNQFNISHIRKCIKLAQIGTRYPNINPFGSVYQENPIKPYRMEGEREGYANSVYLYLISPSAYEFICLTTDWAAQLSRGVVEREEQPSLLWGANYKGTVEGAMIVVVPEFDNYLVPCRGAGGGATATATYSVLLGAGAIAYGMSGMPQLMYEERDYQNVRGIAHTEVCGLRPIKFSSKANPNLKGNEQSPIQVDNGMIHCFASISNT